METALDWSKTIFHTCQEHLDWALQEKARLDVIPVPEGKVVFLGSNPSCSSPYEDPFSHCKSANKILTEWIPALGLTRAGVHFMNVANYKTVGNRALKKSEIHYEVSRLHRLLRGQRVVVTLGTTAQEALILAFKLESDINMVANMAALPHPSGRNRLLNNKVWVKELLEVNKDFIHRVLTEKRTP